MCKTSKFCRLARKEMAIQDLIAKEIRINSRKLKDNFEKFEKKNTLFKIFHNNDEYEIAKDSRTLLLTYINYFRDDSFIRNTPQYKQIDALEELINVLKGRRKAKEAFEESMVRIAELLKSDLSEHPLAANIYLKSHQNDFLKELKEGTTKVSEMLNYFQGDEDEPIFEYVINLTPTNIIYWRKDELQYTCNGGTATISTTGQICLSEDYDVLPLMPDWVYQTDQRTAKFISTWAKKFVTDENIQFMKDWTYWHDNNINKNFYQKNPE